MAKVGGHKSKWKTVKQMDENVQKISRGRVSDCTTGTAARRQKFKVSEWSATVPNRPRFTTAGRVRTDSGWSWTFWIARMIAVLLDCEVALLTSQALAHARFFRRLFDRVPLGSLILDLHLWILQKNSIRLELLILECSFPYTCGHLLTRRGKQSTKPSRDV